MKNMDVDSGEKNRLKEEVRKIWFLIDCYRREFVKEGMIFIVYFLFEFLIFWMVLYVVNFKCIKIKLDILWFGLSFVDF